MQCRLHVAGVLLALGCLPLVPASAQSLTWLGALESTYAEAHGVAADGNAVAGWTGVADPHQAFRWTPDSGMQSLGTLGGVHSEAWGLSRDGRIVVGYSFITSNQYHAFRWENGEMEDLGTLGGPTSWAYDASFDGSVVVGAAIWSGDGRNRAFRWTRSGGMENLGTLPGGIRSVATGVSADGNVVVGWSGFGNLVHHAFRWEDGVMTDIHNPAWGVSEAIDVSDDGNVVVGAWADLSWTPVRAFRWTSEAGMEDLGTLGGEWSEAWGSNADGSIVVGWAERATGDWRAYRWTPENGMEDLNLVYGELLTDGSELEDARDISPDGRFIVGRGIRPDGRYEAYLLDTRATIPGDFDGDGDVDIADFGFFTSCFTGSGVPCAGDCCAADLDGDGDVDIADFAILASNFTGSQ